MPPTSRLYSYTFLLGKFYNGKVIFVAVVCSLEILLYKSIVIGTVELNEDVDLQVELVRRVIARKF